MTCKDCLHSDVCERFSDDVAIICRKFKNEADFVKVTYSSWRLETDEEMPDPMMKLVVCTCCNKTANNTYAFCPNCGAKMIVKEGNNNVKIY